MYLEQVRKICIRFSLVSHKKRDARFGLQDERNTLIIDFLKEAHLCLWQAKIEVEIVTVEPISLRICKKNVSENCSAEIKFSQESVTHW